ncbi:MAG TPA: hypothetical protein VM470_07105 [Acidimicrobiia bacterium]|nr:hypothetical protein [Acidimicrobiia bacterium]
MSPDSETVAALRRAGRRVAFHLVRAAVEGLKAIEAVVDELATVGQSDPDKPENGKSDRQRIEIE